MNHSAANHSVARDQRPVTSRRPPGARQVSADARMTGRSVALQESVVMPAILGLAAFGLYLATAARTITWAHGGADGAELAAAAATLGIPHPTGYPLYMLLGHLFSWLPFGEVAFRVGLLSAVPAGVAVGLAAHIALSLAPGGVAARRCAGLAAAASLIASPLFWSQAVIVEVYALHAALVMAGISLLVGWQPGLDRRLVLLALVLGLGLGNHVTMAVLLFPSLAYVLWRDPAILGRRGTLLLAGGAFLAGISVYLYLPLRAAADPALNWGEPGDLRSFMAHVTAASYQTYLVGGDLLDRAFRVPAAARILAEQITWVGVPLAIAGLAHLARQRRQLGAMLLLYLALTIAFAVLYRAHAGEVYMIPAVLVLAVAIGICAGDLASSRVGAVLAVLLAGSILGWNLIGNWQAMNLRQDESAIEYARSTLAAAGPRAILVTDRDEHTFALWYAQLVEGLRPDVVVVDRRLPALEWYRTQIERRHPGLFERLQAGDRGAEQVGP